MSTTVSYKGNTIATVNNNTKTLETEGKYLEADIILTDVSTSIPDGDEMGYGSSGAAGTWYFNSSVIIPSGANTTYNINFTSNNSSYTGITLMESMGALGYYASGINNLAYRSDWLDENYRTITITGGTDAENATFVTWLEANATKTA